MSISRALLLLGLVACAEEIKDPGTLVTGTIEIQGADAPAQVEQRAAFGFNGIGPSGRPRAIVYVAGPEEASCEQVATLLSGEDPKFDPSPLWMPDNCNLVLTAEYSGAPLSLDIGPKEFTGEATPSLSCQLGEGDFVWEERDKDDIGWFWSGRTWQGGPTEWSVDLSGGDGEPLMLDLRMDRWDGDFIYEPASPEAPGTGLLSGTARAEWCEGLERAMVF